MIRGKDGPLDLWTNSKSNSNSNNKSNDNSKSNPFY